SCQDDFQTIQLENVEAKLRDQTDPVLEKVGQGGKDGTFQLPGRQAPALAIAAVGLHQPMGDVVAVAASLLDRMRWRETVARLVEDEPGQETRLYGSFL